MPSFCDCDENFELLTGESDDISADDRFRGGQTEVCNPV